jgi:hypothetical protein
MNEERDGPFTGDMFEAEVARNVPPWTRVRYGDVRAMAITTGISELSCDVIDFFNQPVSSGNRVSEIMLGACSEYEIAMVKKASLN